MVAPALLHYTFIVGPPTMPGIGVPMATDIAFAQGVLAMLGRRGPTSLKVFVVAYAVIDALGANWSLELARIDSTGIIA